MKTKKPKLKKLISEGLRDYVDIYNEPREEEPLRFMATEGLNVPEMVGEFTTGGDSFHFR